MDNTNETAEPSGASGGSVVGDRDIIARLRDWRSVHLARLHEVMSEAADEIERLRGRAVRLPSDLLIGHRLIKTALDEAGVKWVEVAE